MIKFSQRYDYLFGGWEMLLLGVGVFNLFIAFSIIPSTLLSPQFVGFLFSFTFGGFILLRFAVKVAFVLRALVRIWVKKWKAWRETKKQNAELES